MDCCRGTDEGDGDGEGEGDGDGDRVSSSGQFPLTVPIKTNAIIKLYISGLAIMIITVVSKRSWLISFYNNCIMNLDVPHFMRYNRS